jgi:hypothetical protein
MEPEKVKAILDWPTPTNLTQLQSFLGFTNFYRQFIKGYADICKPLNELQKKDILFAWTPIHAKAMDKLKERITNAPTL